MDGFAFITSITSLNGIGLGRLFVGGQLEANLGSMDISANEATVAVIRLLRRSEATLTKVDLRSEREVV